MNVWSWHLNLLRRKTTAELPRASDSDAMGRVQVDPAVVLLVARVFVIGSIEPTEGLVSILKN